MFNQRELSPYNLRSYPDVRVPFTRTLYHGSESISYLDPKIWNFLPPAFNEAVLFNSFEKLIKEWVPQELHTWSRYCWKPTIKSVSFLIIDFLIYLLQWFSWLSPFLCFFYGIFRNQIVHIHGVGYRTSEALSVEYFVIIAEGFHPFIMITETFIWCCSGAWSASDSLGY